MSKFVRNQLTVLAYDIGGALFKVTKLLNPTWCKKEIKGLIINLESGQWRRSKDSAMVNIGTNRPFKGHEGGTIVGIYDLSLIDHQRAMINIINEVASNKIKQAADEAMSPVQKYEGG